MSRSPSPGADGPSTPERLAVPAPEGGSRSNRSVSGRGGAGGRVHAVMHLVQAGRVLAKILQRRPVSGGLVDVLQPGQRSIARWMSPSFSACMHHRAGPRDRLRPGAQVDQPIHCEQPGDRVREVSTDTASSSRERRVPLALVGADNGRGDAAAVGQQELLQLGERVRMARSARLARAPRPSSRTSRPPSHRSTPSARSTKASWGCPFSSRGMRWRTAFMRRRRRAPGRPASPR